DLVDVDPVEDLRIERRRTGVAGIHEAREIDEHGIVIAAVLVPPAEEEAIVLLVLAVAVRGAARGRVVKMPVLASGAGPAVVEVEAIVHLEEVTFVVLRIPKRDEVAIGRASALAGGDGPIVDLPTHHDLRVLVRNARRAAVHPRDQVVRDALLRIASVVLHVEAADALVERFPTRHGHAPAPAPSPARPRAPG